MAVRYDKNFMAEINKVIRAYNSKITRLSKIDTDYVLPARFDQAAVQAMKNTSTTRADVRRRLKDLQAFTQRGGEKNIRIGNATIPRYQYTNIKRYQRLAKIRINKKLRRYETTKPVNSGKIEKFTFAELGSNDYVNLLAKKERLLSNINLETMTTSERDMYLHKLRVNTRNVDLDMWQKNYIDIFQDTALSYGYDPEKLDTIVWALQRLDADEFDEVAFEDRNIKEVLTHYKALLDIQTAEAFEKSSATVIDNLDAIYDNLSGILSKIE